MLTVDQKVEIFNAVKAGTKLKDLSVKYGVTASRISQIVKEGRVGKFSVDPPVELDSVDEPVVKTVPVPPRGFVARFPPFTLTKEEVERLKKGMDAVGFGKVTLKVEGEKVVF